MAHFLYFMEQIYTWKNYYYPTFYFPYILFYELVFPLLNIYFVVALLLYYSCFTNLQLSQENITLPTRSDKRGCMAHCITKFKN